MKRVHTLLLVVIFVFIDIQAACAYDRLSLRLAMDWPPRKNLDVHYEPTPEKVVLMMLDIAAVDKNDLVYDLGCGDGRIVIAAARQKGARGVGIDIDPERIRESNENARKAGVTGRVRFLQQNLFTSEISKATVVMLYLLPSLNLKLRPKLFRELEPGTRVVSHSHDMNEWRADRREKVQGRDIYFWVIPANVTGTWRWTMQDGKKCTLKMSQRFQEVIGTFSFGNTEASVRDITLSGRQLSFTVDRKLKGKTASFRYEGKVAANSIHGRVRSEDSDAAGGAAWKATRDPSTAAEIDTGD